MNVKLLRKIAKVIQERPREFDMRWLHVKNNALGWDEPAEMDCGTAHCICGWAAVIKNNPNLQNNVIGYEAFGILPAQANRLFFVGGWPSALRERYKKAKLDRTRARIAAARIEHFIATEGRE